MPQTAPTIPAYAISSLLACVVISGLGLVSLLYGRRERVRVTFSLFCLSWALGAGCGFALQLAGTGMGLAICRQVVRDHGGEITVESAPGEGTRVSVRLPVRPTSDDGHQSRR